MMQDTSWIDRETYPFKSHYFDSADGRIHYVDEGEGEPILMLHGSLTWSFLYRHLIKALSAEYRCIAIDHLGFGLSDKPENGAYRPLDHAQRLYAFIDHLKLKNITLVVHDFGGPIGLSYAVKHPQNIRSLIILNTWMWSLRGELVVEAAGLAGRGELGKLLFQKLNLELQVLFKLVWGDKKKLSKELHQQYLKALPSPQNRTGITAFARELRDSSAWYEELWQQSENIKDVPVLLLWGLKDLILRPRHLKRWQSLFTNAETVTFPSTGHFLQEEVHGELTEAVKQFLGLNISQKVT